jgi:methionyl-tRNA formyltransferase
MIDVVFVGNRVNVVERLLSMRCVRLQRGFMLGDIPARLQCASGVLTSLRATKECKGVLLDALKNTKYDLLVSGGCPFILPISDLPKDRLYINCHPSALPYGKGKHPLNECFISAHQTVGVSIHHMSDALDEGDIIEQVSFPVTDEMDVSLLYLFVWELEADLLEKAVQRLVENNMRHIGRPQKGDGSWFSRPKERPTFDAAVVGTRELCRYAAGFSSENLGIRVQMADGRTLILYRARPITNEFVVNWFERKPIGVVCGEREDLLILRLKDGLVRIDSWKECEREP